MSLFNVLGALFAAPSPSVSQRIPAAAIDPALASAGARPVARRHYVRFSLDQTLLAGRDWMRTTQPLVVGTIRSRAGGQVLEIPVLFDASRLAGKSVGAADTLIGTFRVSPLMPFRGGDIDIQIGLFAVKTFDYLQKATKLLGGITGAFLGPEVAPFLKLASTVATGIAELVQDDDIACRIAYSHTFSAATLEDGYIGVLREAGKAAPDWCVQQGRWCTLVGGKPEVIRGHDGFLLRTEVLEDRDDWSSIPSIEEPYLEAIRSTREQEESRADNALRLAIAAALTSPDLTEAHRRIVVEEMKASLATERKLAKSGALPAASDAGLRELLAGASVPNAVQRGPISDREAAADWPFREEDT